MLDSELENKALVWSGKLVYRIFWFWFVHFLKHHSTGSPCCPSIIPDLLEIVPEYLSGCVIAARFVGLFLSSSLFGQLVSMLIPSDIRVSRNPLKGDLNVIGGEEAVYAFSKFPNVPVAVCVVVV